jgi:signal peptidase I
MTFFEWFIFFLVIQVIHFLGTWKLYVKAGRESWEAALPIYNGIVLMKMINRPKWWIILLFIPVINLLMFPIIWIETIRTFGFKKKLDSFLVIASLGLYIFYINYATDAKFNAGRSLKPQSELGEWINSITFAIIAATLVHTYFMQPFTIPSSSLEKSLLVGDYLFVSKFHFGARVPSTLIAAPMMHDSIPFTKRASFVSNSENKHSWLNKLSLPYTRIPGFQKIKNNDIVCFNWPADSLKTMWGDTSGKFTYKPVDKKTNYVKRCVAIAGDSLELKNGYVYINGKKNELPYRAKIEFYYTYEAKSAINKNSYPNYLKDNEKTYVFKISTRYWKDARIQNQFKSNDIPATKIAGDSIYTEFIANKMNSDFAKKFGVSIVENKRNINLTKDEAQRLRKYSQTLSLKKLNHGADNAIFPQIESNQWSQDNMGPIYIPKAGVTVKIDAASLPYYEQIIKNYENNDLQVVGDNIFINGEKTDSYTFQQDYYWLMGDNRHNSLDARYWGYVPFDHVLGKPVMVWFSWDPSKSGMELFKSIRWDRMFTTVHGDGEPVSYRYLVFTLIALYIGFSFYKGKKVKK